jgi:hypothetical protein
VIFIGYLMFKGSRPNESYPAYLTTLMKYGWPYLVIVAVYELIGSGSMATIFHAAGGGRLP